MISTFSKENLYPTHGGTYDVFTRGCATLWSLHRHFLEIFYEKIGPFGLFVPNGGLQNTILMAVFELMASIFQNFS